MNTPPNQNIPDETFTKELEDSHRFVLMAAEWLKEIGYKVLRVPEPVLRPDVKDRFDFADCGDILMDVHNKTWVVEVKRRKYSYTSKEDYPFESVWIDSVYKIKRGWTCPLFGYVIYNIDGSVGIYVSGISNSLWKIERHLDRRVDKYFEIYTIPKEFVYFF